MRSGQIRESCGCNNAGCRSFSFCGRPKAESALRHFEKKGNAPSVLRLVSLPAVRFSVRIADGSPGRMAALSLHSFFGSRVKWPVRDAVGYMQPAASGGQKDIGMGRPLMWPLVFDTSAWRRAEGREIRRNFSKIYSELPRPVMCRQDPDRMVEF